MKIQIVGESGFKIIEGVRRIIQHEHPHQFGLLDLGELGSYGLSWSGKFVTPELVYSIDRQYLWVGVDQQLAVIDLQDGHIHLSLPLFSNLFQILIAEDVIAVLTELEAILFNADCSIRFMTGLPDLAESIAWSGTEFVIPLLHGTVLLLNAQTGELKESASTYRRG